MEVEQKKNRSVYNYKELYKMRQLIFLLLFFTSIVAVGQEKVLYDFKVTDIDGKVFDFSLLKGKKVLIVNVASKCGLTPQYEQLEALQKEYKNLVIVGFPCNNFKGQEPGTNDEIKEFCSITYGISFPMMSKVEVKGENQAPIYKWLTRKSENGKFDAEVQWNFQKFMIDESGYLVDFAPPKESPKSPRIIKWLENK